MEDSKKESEKQKKPDSHFRKQIRKLIRPLSKMELEHKEHYLKIFQLLINMHKSNPVYMEFLFSFNSLTKMFNFKRSLIIRNTDSMPTFRLFDSNSYYGKNFTEINLIGFGCSGKVFIARHKLDQVDYAIKKVQCSCTEAFEINMAEVKALAKLDHPNVVTYKNAWIEPVKEGEWLSESDLSSENSSCNLVKSDRTKNSLNSERYEYMMLYIQMNLCKQNLRDWLSNRQSFSSVSEINAIGTQILCGLNYLHKLSYTHHDVNPNNIFISNGLQGLQIKLGDFGMACSSRRNCRSKNCGTPPYVAPEQLRGKCSCKSDIYSFGIVLLEVLIFTKTFNEFGVYLQNLKKGIIPIDLMNKYPEWVHIIVTSIVEDLTIRPSADYSLKYLEIFNNNIKTFDRLILMDTYKNFYDIINAKNVLINKLQEDIKKKNGYIRYLKSNAHKINNPL